MDKVSRFFLFCSGVYQSLLEDCPSEKNKFVGIGASIFFTGLFATFAAIYTLTTIFHQIYAPILIGICWGLMIFNLDRYIVSSIKKHSSIKMNIISIVPRLVLAIMLSIVIAKPLELKIFEQEINDELALIQKEYHTQMVDSIKADLKGQLVSLQNIRDDIKNELKARIDKRDELVAISQQEADGTGGSGKRNLGPIYQVKKQNLINYQEELERYQLDQKTNLSQIQHTEDSLKAQAQTAILEIHSPTAKGIAAQLHALNRLSNKSKTIWWAVFFITLLFIIVESTPIILKTLTPKGPYDELLAETEKSYILGHKKSP